ncbi:unnamed protein product [Moneuplotes crassus]|uniref:Uncharacterized protein n=1 Tax=Euplotes crassus TaxID=5936 RepID=A0AAD1XWZ6_EUPCR|nr:unnamed protein product [Moneuplotes crassus]
MFQSLFGCCTKRENDSRKNIYSEAPESHKDDYIDLLNQTEKKLRIRSSDQKPLLQRVIKKIKKKSYQGAIELEELMEIIEKYFIHSDNKEAAYRVNTLTEFFEQQYFQSDEDGEEGFLDSLKINCFLLLICTESENNNKASKTNELIQLMLEVAIESEHDEASEGTKHQFYRKDPITLEVLSILFSGAIIPFIQKCEVQLCGDEHFERLLNYATTNQNVFYHFAKFMLKNYIFTSAHKRNRQKSKSVSYSPSKFQGKMTRSFQYFFEIKMIRKKFLYFAKSHRDLCLESSDIQIVNSRKQFQGYSQDEEKTETYASKKEEVEENPFFNNSEIFGTFGEKLDIDEEKLPNFNTTHPNQTPDTIQERLETLSNYVEEDRHPLEGGISQTKYNFNGTIVLGAKSNQSFLLDKSQTHENSEAQFIQELNDKYGQDLVNMLDLHFEKNVTQGVYWCDPKICKIPALKDKFKMEYEDGSESEKIQRPRFSHSFRYSSHLGNQDESNSNVTAQAYLKSVIKSQTSYRQFYEFYLGEYSNSIGVINSYLRLLEVYEELTFSQEGFQLPNQNYSRTKIFETDLLDEFETEISSGIISDALDEEFQDFYKYNLLIVPIFKEGTLLIFVVIVEDENPQVKLYFEEDKISEEDDERMMEYSQIIIDLLERAYLTVGMNFDDRNIEGKSIPIKSIPEMVQQVEDLILVAPDESHKLSEDSIRHKIVDRLLSVYKL